MKLNEEETEMLKRLKDHVQGWRRQRWYGLVAGTFAAVAGAWLVLQVAERAASTDRWDASVTWCAPAFWSLFLIGVAMSTVTLKRWRGDAVAMLLVKLADVPKEPAERIETGNEPGHNPTETPAPAQPPRGKK
jgi:hypothetical protein